MLGEGYEQHDENDETEETTENLENLQTEEDNEIEPDNWTGSDLVSMTIIGNNQDEVDKEERMAFDEENKEVMRSKKELLEQNLKKDWIVGGEEGPGDLMDSNKINPQEEEGEVDENRKDEASPDFGTGGEIECLFSKLGASNLLRRGLASPLRHKAQSSIKEAYTKVAWPAMT